MGTRDMWGHGNALSLATRNDRPNPNPPPQSRRALSRATIKNRST
ncbi:hypothetical protein QUB17_28495 [Microcoleus sp. B5-C4]